MKYNFRLSIGLVGCIQEDEFEVDDSELEGKSEEEIDEYIEECWKDWAWNYIDGGWSES